MVARNNFEHNKPYRRFVLRSTKICNLKCPFCTMAKELKKEKIPEVDIKNLNLQLSKSEYFNNCINVTGGEPMFRPKELFDLFDQIDWSYVDKLSIFTNGTIYDENVIDKIENYHPRASFGVAPKIYTKDWDWEVLEKLVNRLGDRAVFSPVLTINDIGKMHLSVKKAYDLGFRTFSFRWDNNVKDYQIPFFEEMERIFKILPKDIKFIASVNNCSVIKYSREDLSNIFSLSTNLTDFWNFDGIEEYFNSTPEQIVLNNKQIDRENANAWLAIKNGHIPLPAQHTDWWN